MTGRRTLTRDHRWPSVLIALVLAFGAMSTGCGGDDLSPTGDAVSRALNREPVILRVDSLLARTTALDSTRPIERGWGLLAREDEVLVADAMAGRIYRFGHDGSPVGAIGSPGQGPGELARPTVLRAGGEGRVAVLDEGAARIAALGPEGEPVGSAPLRIPTTSFAPGTEGRFLVPSASDDAFFEVASLFSEPRPVEVTDSLPPVLAEMSPMEKAGFMRLMLAPADDERSIHVLRNFGRLGVWKVTLDAAWEEIATRRRCNASA